MKGLALIGRTSGRGTWNIISWHSPHSMTWSWILSVSLPRSGEGRWLHAYRYRNNDRCLQWGFQIARIGVRWHQQRPMWYRDLYQRKRDQFDHLEQAIEHSSQEGPPPRSPFTPTIIDGGRSVH